MKKSLVTLFIITLMLGASLSAVSMVAASSEDDDVQEPYGASEDDEEIVETEHDHEEEDEEEEEALESELDMEGDLHVNSTDNTIEFEKDGPQIHIKYDLPNETEIEFEANDFALIEFMDADSNGTYDKGEEKRRLEFDNITWSFNHTETVEGDNTILTVTYHANSTDYEIALVMKVFQRRETMSSATLDEIVVYDVDGGADEVKFDLIVSRWIWADESSQLAFFMELESEVEGEVARESASVDEGQLAIKLDSVRIEVGWVKKAKIVSANGSEDFVNVTAADESLDIEQEESEIELKRGIYFVYPHFGENKLIHDPSIGIEDDPLLYIFNLITPEILLGTAITATAIAAAAVAFTRRRKRLPSFKGAAI